MSHSLRGKHYAAGAAIELKVDGDRILSVAALVGVEAEQVGRLWLTPALVDIQVNGFGGVDFNGPGVNADQVAKATRGLWTAGVAYYCPTVTTGSRGSLIRSLQGVAEACRLDAATRRAVLGVHLEGPYISSEDGPRGAHSLADVRPPDWDEFLALQEAADGLIRIVTLAPELPGALPFIEKLVAHGIVVALGHLAANAEQIAAAVAAGAKISTHLGNGAHAMLPRHPNYVWDQLACDDLFASIIPDGHHLPPSVVKCLLRAKGVDRTVLVSDAVHLAGLKPGVYSFMGQSVELAPGGMVELVGTPYLAGSALRLVEGLGNVISFAQVKLSEAVQMATDNPRRLLGLPIEGHDLTEGSLADLLILRGDAVTGDLSLVSTMLAGEPVYRAGEV